MNKNHFCHNQVKKVNADLKETKESPVLMAIPVYKVYPVLLVPKDQEETRLDAIFYITF